MKKKNATADIGATRLSRAQVSELRRLSQDGTVRAREIVDAARDESSVLHSLFEWDDTEAAEQWRLYQARHIVRKVYIVLSKHEERKTRFYVSLRSEREKGGGVIRVVTNIMSDDDLRAEYIEDAKADLKAFRDKYETLRELSGFASLFKAIDAALGDSDTDESRVCG